ncbi:MGT family glycosyltransferase [Actinopolyspora biskrensis]|uniref:MGT family glycosyltransferase n=1 Tax=Actinopolyspora biskrensis TaxID=1470178 RepID=A0A852Z2X9_9ACTN|nr:MGT family glycosyltransferase [Actinopolyspora biskrensis]
MSRHFAFVVPAAHGHVTPTLPLVGELLRRGHRVSCATGEDFVADVASTGARTVALPAKPPPPLRTVEGRLSMDDFLKMADHSNATARACFPVLMDHFESDRPDLVCFETRDLAGRMLVDRLGSAGAALVPTLASNESFSLQAGMVPSSFDPQHPDLVELGRKMEEFTRAHGVSTPTDPSAAGTPDLNLVFIPREFQVHGDLFDDRFRFIGPAVIDRDDTVPGRAGAEDRPLLFVSLGTVFNQNPDFFQSCVDAFRNTEWRVAVATGGSVGPEELEGVSDNFDIRPHFSQSEMLNRASAFLSHAGMNSIMDAVYYEVPLLAAPQMPEQQINANRLEELGAGRRVRPDEFTADGLYRAVSRVATDGGIRENLAGMRAALDSCGGASEGADALERRVDAVGSR